MSENRSLAEYDVGEEDLEDGFHPNADEKAREITNDERDYGIWGQCTRDPTSTTGKRCTQPARGPHGKCQYHGGADGTGAHEGNQNAVGNSGGAAPEGNTNAVKHGAYAKCNSVYQDILDDGLRELVDEIFADYMEQYEELHDEPPLGIETELFRISVTHVKDIVLENWAQDRPSSLDPGNPMIDRETKYTEGGQQYYEYKESIVIAAQGKLSRDRRGWLKDLNLLKDPESRKADALEDGLDFSLSIEEKEELDQTFDVDPMGEPQ